MTDIRVYGPDEQGAGEFDGGTITERKPIGFPGEGSKVDRIGPLFYWAWAFADHEGYIGSHPHQAFEILTYVIQGEAHHGDSLGTNSIVGPGGAQLIQAGSGVSHNERIVGPDAELFQIWFEPSIREALRREPAYHQFEHSEFEIIEQEGTTVKSVIDGQSPIQIVADAQMWDVTMTSKSTYTHRLNGNRALAVLAVRGNGTCVDSEGESRAFRHKDFVVIQHTEDRETIVSLQANPDSMLRLVIIEVPMQVQYSLYPKRR